MCVLDHLDLDLLEDLKSFFSSRVIRKVTISFTPYLLSYSFSAPNRLTLLRILVITLVSRVIRKVHWSMGVTGSVKTRDQIFLNQDENSSTWENRDDQMGFFFSPKFGLQRIFHTPSCGRVSWLLGEEGQQLALLLWLVRLILNTQTRFSSEPSLAFILFTEFHWKEKLKLEW